MKTEVKWVTLENESGTGSLKTHGFIPTEQFRRYTGEQYEGNISLCGRVFAGNGNEEVEDFSRLKNEGYSHHSCKLCARKYENLKK